MRGGYKLGKGDVKTASQLVAQDENVELADYFLRGAARTSGKKQVMPKSVNQRRYLDAIEQHDIVFGIGPAGTGKTYLAMAQAVAFLLAKRVSRIILARPAVEAGEKLGFLPGDLQEKVNPYLRPLYDALYDMMEIERADRLLERGTIEVAPIAFMRGRTLNDAFVILDEAQNTTSEQMKMFLTRLGFGSKAVITGDITQIDLPIGAPVRARRGHEGGRQRRRHRVHPLRREGRRAASARAADREGVRSLRWIPTVSASAVRARGALAGMIEAPRRLRVIVSDGRGRAVRDGGLVAMAGRGRSRPRARRGGRRARHRRAHPETQSPVPEEGRLDGRVVLSRVAGSRIPDPGSRTRTLRIWATS